MTNVVSALLVEAEEPLARTRVEQLLMDGYEVDGVIAVQAARVKLADGPDALPAAPLSGPACVTDSTAVSQDRDGYPQIRSRTADRQLRDPMIGAMTDMSSNPPADRSSAVTGYRPAYSSSYTHVYMEQKEVS